MAKDFQNGWSGLKEYAAKCGVINVDDNDDVAAAKIRAIIRDTLPESEVEAYEPKGDDDADTEETGGGLMDKAKEFLGGSERTDSESETEA